MNESMNNLRLAALLLCIVCLFSLIMMWTIKIHGEKLIIAGANSVERNAQEADLELLNVLTSPYSMAGNSRELESRYLDVIKSRVDAEFHRRLALVFERQGNSNKALAEQLNARLWNVEEQPLGQRLEIAHSALRLIGSNTSADLLEIKFRAAIAAGEFNQADEILVSMKPLKTSDAIDFLQGQLQLMQGDLIGARGSWRDALRRNPMNMDALRKIVFHADSPNLYKECVTYLSAAITLNPNAAELWHLLGIEQVKLGELDKALVSYGKAYGLNSSNSAICRDFADALERSGQEKRSAAIRKSIQHQFIGAS